MNKKRKKPVALTQVNDDSWKVKELPAPAGEWPYRLDLRRVMPEIKPDCSVLCFHLVGDTGSIKESPFQHRVAAEMSKQILEEGGGPNPVFLLHLGDIVYNYGEAQEYPRQFFGPYEQYPAPIFAISGNHDADVNPEALSYKSLDAFMAVFCSKFPGELPFSGGSKRLSMTQPNVYWTLKTPLAHVICLYGNATKFGYISPEQREWFVAELRTAALEKPEQAILVCLHHAPYSADTNHGSSLAMIHFLEEAYQEAGIRPDLVLSGHVHNYQRYSRVYSDGGKVAYVVAGAGGYADLHRIAEPGNMSVNEQVSELAGSTLENYCDESHGFLKLTLERSPLGVLIKGEYYLFLETSEDPRVGLFESFQIKAERVG